YFVRPVELGVASAGEFSASGLSPTAYTISFEAPGSVSQTRAVELEPGETLDLGTIRLERPRQIAVTYREASSPPFTQAPPGRQRVPGGGRFKARNAPGSAYDLWFEQRNREIHFVFDYGPCQIADLGHGKLDDFLGVDPTSTRFTPPSDVVPQPGHVYLLDQ